MMSGPILILIGPPGSGKSTVGRLVAAKLGVSFRDFDDDLKNECGLPAGELVVKLGRERFSEVESSLIGAVLADHGGVLALGGGTPLNPEIQEQLRDWFRFTRGCSRIHGRICGNYSSNGARSMRPCRNRWCRRQVVVLRM
jgi:hypothetical protein